MAAVQVYLKQKLMWKALFHPNGYANKQTPLDLLIMFVFSSLHCYLVFVMLVTCIMQFSCTIAYIFRLRNLA